MEEVDEILAHYGKRGMRWGVRSTKIAVSRGPQDVMIGEKPGKRIVAIGGRGHPATEEAKRAAGLAQKAKRSGTQSLTNKELKELNERMNLEQNYSKLTGTQAQARKSKGRKLADNILKESGKLVTSQIKTAATQQLGKALIKKAATP